MQKKGIAKTLEAAIAIILIFSFIYYFTPKQEIQDPTISGNVQDAQAFLLQAVSIDDTLRKCALQATTTGECTTVGCTGITALVQQYTPPGYAAACEICPTASTCAITTPLQKSVYTDSVFLSDKNPRVLRVYMWENP